MDEKIETVQDNQITKRQDLVSLHTLIRQTKIEQIANHCKNIKAEDIHLIESFDEKGNTPLICAIQQKNDEIIDLLLISGANPHQQNRVGETPVTTAVKENYPSAITRLLEEGALINQVNSDNESPLKIAIKLGHKECINILTEHRVPLAKHHHIPVKFSTNPTDGYLDTISHSIKTAAQEKDQDKKIHKIFSEVTKETEIYLNKTLDKESIKINLAKLKDYILETLQNSASEKNILNIVRKIIVNIQSQIRITLIQNEDTHSINLMSKAENCIEEQITKLKHTENKSCNSTATHASQGKEKNSQEKNFVLSSYTTSKNCDFTTTKILCRTSANDVVLTVTASIKPHNLKTRSQVQQYSDPMQNILNDTELKQIKDVADSCKNRDLTSEETHLIEKLLRHGKSEKIHILHFSTNTIIDNDIYSEAIETGATLHCLQYHANSKEINNLVLTGIANINRLLDDGIHPDKIILQGDTDQKNILEITADQFAKRGIILTKIFFDPNISLQCNHRNFSTNLPIKHSDDCPKEMVNSFEKINKLHNSKKRPLTNHQIINLLIAGQQQFFLSSSKHRNPALPKERVENIISTTGINE